MKYILMMHCPRTGYDSFGAWPKKDIQAHIAFMHQYNKDLRESGEWVSGEGLAGYWIVDVESQARAEQLAAKASAAPGPGGPPLNMPIEVRQVMSGPTD